MTILALGIILFSGSLIGQNLEACNGIKVEYIFSQKRNGRLISARPERVYFYRNKSLSVISVSGERSIQQDTDNAGNKKVVMKLAEEGDSFVYTDYANEEIKNKIRFFQEDFIVEDKVPQFKWSFTGKKKTIATYNTMEATTDFRGRHYSVWFSPDLPINGGPWKFSGLPGIILEVQDSEDDFNWVCSAITELSERDVKLIAEPSGRRIVTNDEFYDLMRNKLKSWMESIAVRANGSLTSEVSFDESSFLEVTK
ncbi:GLPGLI family protein [Neolewinella aurantiaca]|uniref:GLPGLI family protein n=1 Tax=Neolewinella aurantiaca TaxID=2602767 RepID=UPI00165088AE|nr:GLPGLI family protein [Neolewinella aurantiaca]